MLRKICLLTLAVFILLSVKIFATEVCEPPSSGDWNINTTVDQYCQNRNIIMNGNVIIRGNLTLDGSTLQVNNPNNQIYNITAVSPGNFTVFGSSNITAYSLKTFNVSISTRLRLNDSFVNFVDGNTIRGFYIGNSNTQIINTTFRNVGVVRIDATSVVINNSRILNSTRGAGIIIASGGAETISWTNFTSNNSMNYFIYNSAGGNNNNIHNNTFDCFGRVESSIYLSSTTGNSIFGNLHRNCTGVGTTGTLSLISSSNNNRIINNTFEYSGRISINVYTSSSGNNLTNNYFYNSGSNDFDIDTSNSNNVSGNYHSGSGASSVFLCGAAFNTVRNEIIWNSTNGISSCTGSGNQAINYIYNITINSTAQNGFVMYSRSNSSIITNITINNTKGIGVYVLDSNNVSFQDVNISNSDQWDLTVNNSQNVTFVNVIVGWSTAQETRINATGANNVNLIAVASLPASPQNYLPLNHSVNVTNLSEKAFWNLYIFYDRDDIAEINKTNTTLLKWDGVGWSNVPMTLDIGANATYVNFTNFSTTNILGLFQNITPDAPPPVDNPPPPPSGNDNGDGGPRPEPDPIYDLPEEEIDEIELEKEIDLTRDGVKVNIDPNTFLTLFPLNHFTAVIHNISKIDPSTYKVLVCNQASIASYEINVTADIAYFCINYTNTPENIPEPTLSVLKFIDGNWSELNSTEIKRDAKKKIICGKIQSTPYMIAGLRTTPESELALQEIELANNSIRDARLKGVDVTNAENKFNEAVNFYYRCEYKTALQLARQALNQIPIAFLEFFRNLSTIGKILLILILLSVAGAFIYYYKRLRKRIEIKRH